MSNDTFERVQKAREHLKALEQEFRQLPDRIASATLGGDFKELERLSERRQKLPHEIWTAKVALLQAQIAHFEQQREVAAQERRKAKEELERVHQAHQAALKALEDARAAFMRADGEMHYCTSEVGRCRRELDELLAQKPR